MFQKIKNTIIEFTEKNKLKRLNNMVKEYNLIRSKYSWVINRLNRLSRKIEKLKKELKIP